MSLFSQVKPKDKREEKKEKYVWRKVDVRHYLPEPEPTPEPLVIIQPEKETIKEIIRESEPREQPIKFTMVDLGKLKTYEFTPPSKPFHKAVPEGHEGKFTVSSYEGDEAKHSDMNIEQTPSNKLKA